MKLLLAFLLFMVGVWFLVVGCASVFMRLERARISREHDEFLRRNGL